MPIFWFIYRSNYKPLLSFSIDFYCRGMIYQPALRHSTQHQTSLSTIRSLRQCTEFKIISRKSDRRKQSHYSERLGEFIYSYKLLLTAGGKALARRHLCKKEIYLVTNHFIDLNNSGNGFFNILSLVQSSFNFGSLKAQKRKMKFVVEFGFQGSLARE